MPLNNTNWVVVNPGSLPEMSHMALALAEYGESVALVAPFPNGTTALTAPLLARAGYAARHLAKRATWTGVERVPYVTPSLSLDLLDAAHVASRRLAFSRRLRTRLEHSVRRPDLVVFKAKKRRLIAEAVKMSKPADVIVIHASLCDGESYTQIRARNRVVLVYGTAHPKAQYDQWLLEWRRHPSMIKRPQEPETSLERTVASLKGPVAAVSEWSARTFIEQGHDPETVHYLQLGISTTSSRPAGRPTGDYPMRVLNFGRITRGKGLVDLVTWLDQVPNVELTLCGDIDGSVTLPSHNRLQVIPRQSRIGTQALFETHDVGIFPSYSEGICYSAVEAWASGLPVIVSPYQFLAEPQTTNNPLVVEPWDYAAYGRALSAIANRSPTDSAFDPRQVTISWDDRRPTLARKLAAIVATQ